MNINVFGYENKVYPLYVSKKSHTQTLNLTQEGKSHYVFIKDFNRLMFLRTKHKDKKHQCMSCLQNFTTEEILSNHKKQCLLINGCQALNYESGIIKFTNYEKQVPISFKIYADTECFLKRTNSYEGEHLTKYQEHFPNSINAKLVCINDRFTLTSFIFKGKDCINKFIVWVLDKQKCTKQITEQYLNKKLILSNDDEEIYKNSHICWICREELDKNKVRDNCHITGKFRGAAHNQFNLKLKMPKKLPIFFLIYKDTMTFNF